MFLFLISFLFLLGQLGRISFFNQEINVYVYEIAISLHIAILFFTHRLKPFQKYGKHLLLMYLFFGWMGISYIVSFSRFTITQNLVGFLYFTRLSMYFIWGIYVYFERKKQNIKWFAMLLFILGAISLLQFVFYPDLVNLRYLGWDMHFNRMFSIFFDTSIASGVFGILVWLIFFLKKSFLDKKIWLTLLLMIFVCALLTFSRNFYLAFLLSVLYFSIMKKNMLIIVTYVILFSVMMLVVPKNFGPGVGLNRVFTINARISEFARTMEVWQQSPIFGVGYNRIKYMKQNINQIPAQTEFALHSAASFSSSFAILFATVGIIGLVLAVLLLVRIGLMNQELSVILVFVSMMSLGDNIFLHPFVMVMLIFSAVMLSRLSDK